ncbi:MAG: DUF485 domain-containing protein [Bifidobacteriaceae bacterium]|jgi:uncharacterized membrane protein (DUF485 family)|nr:DUF485 domain-containing protein [Bifidobacteriaceae bacterium]
MGHQPKHAASYCAPAASPLAAEPQAPVGVDYLAIENSPQFRRLRSTQRRFVIPVVAAGLAWYLAYVLAASWAPGFMATKVTGFVNWAIVIGLVQILTTFGATLMYVWFANKKLDPEAARIRRQIESAAGGAV